MKRIVSGFLFIMVMFVTTLTSNMFGYESNSIIKGINFDENQQEALDSKIIDQYRKPIFGQDENLEKVEVTYQLRSEYLENGELLLSQNEHGLYSNKGLSEYRQSVKNVYYNFNLEFLSILNLQNNYLSVEVSEYSPFIRFYYENYEEFLESKHTEVQEELLDKIEMIYVNNETKVSDSATRNITNTTNYPFEDALEDVGITDGDYDGSGIKVGTLESGVPNSTINLTGKTFLFNNTTTTTVHSFQVTSIVGGTSGIAQGVEMYCVSAADIGFFNGINWLISQEVNIINISWGDQSGAYDANGAFLDFISRSTRVSFVVAAHNGGNNRAVNSYSNGLNIISVASIDENLNISSFSGAGLQIAAEGFIDKPTITAPGGRLSNIANVTGTLSGTSFAAPIVTGIVARLMEEFPSLISHPEAVTALLIASATRLTSHNGVWDHDAGAGLINYNKARNIYNEGNNRNFISNPSMTNGALVSSKTISVSSGDIIRLKGTWLYNSQTTTPGTGAFTPLYTNYRIEIRNQSNVLVRTITTDSNILFIDHTFTSGGNHTINIIMNSNKVGLDYEYGSLFYDLEFNTHTHSFGYYSQYNRLYHRKDCSCGEYMLETHNWIMIPYDDGIYIGLQQYCPDCGELGIIMLKA